MKVAECLVVYANSRTNKALNVLLLVAVIGDLVKVNRKSTQSRHCLRRAGWELFAT